MPMGSAIVVEILKHQTLSNGLGGDTGEAEVSNIFSPFVVIWVNTALSSSVATP